jgi:hypothetical protein
MQNHTSKPQIKQKMNTKSKWLGWNRIKSKKHGSHSTKETKFNKFKNTYKIKNKKQWLFSLNNKNINKKREKEITLNSRELPFTLI